MMDPNALKEQALKQTKLIVGSNYQRMTESRRVARLANFLHEVLLKFDEDFARYFIKHSHWILAIVGCVVTSTVVVVVSNWLTRRYGSHEKKKLNSKLAEALQEVHDLQGKLAEIASAEHKEKIQEAKKAGKEVRIWMDGAFDMMHYGHMNAFRQGKALGTYLIVGVNSDESITVNKGQPVCNDEERLACVMGCKFVDEIVTNVPYVMSPEYVKFIIEKYNIDYIVHGDDPCLTPDGKDVYESAKELDKYRSIPRTEGVSTTDIVGRMLLNTRAHHNAHDSYDDMLKKESESKGGKETTPEKKLGRVRAESMQQHDDEDDDKQSAISVAHAQELLKENALHEALYKRKSNFLTTSHILRLFSAGVSISKCFELNFCTYTYPLHLFFLFNSISLPFLLTLTFPFFVMLATFND